MSSLQKETLVAEPQSAANHKIGGSRGRRAELLANRIEEGAAGLAAFAEGLSDAEWRTPMSAKDRRTVGVIVHHVASMYPIEVGLARTVAERQGCAGGYMGACRRDQCQACSGAGGSHEGRGSRTPAPEQRGGGRGGAHVHG